jgi:amino acid permease
MFRRLLATKPIAAIAEVAGADELHRTLDARALVLLGIGAIIGTCRSMRYTASATACCAGLATDTAGGH